MNEPVTARRLIDAGLSRSFAHFVVRGDRNLSVPTALWLLDSSGLTAGPLIGKSDDELALLREMYPPAPPPSARKPAAEKMHG